jgi:hypothetical protein
MWLDWKDEPCRAGRCTMPRIASAPWSRQRSAANPSSSPSAVVVVAAEEFEKLEALRVPSFAEHLLAMPQDDEAFDRIEVDLCDPAL